MGELAKENPDRSYRDLERYRDEDRAQEAGACIMAEARKDREEEGKEIDYHRYWKDMYEKSQARIKELENNRPLDFPMDEMAYNEAKHRVKELDNSLAIALEINEEHQRYNGKLQTRLTELEEENKKLHDALNNKLESVRKAGL